MRLAAVVSAVTLAGCSGLLGIEDPVPRKADAGVDPDSPVLDANDDAPAADAPPAASTLVFSVTALNIARHQGARLHVLRMRAGEMVDVTASVALASSDIAIASVSTGQISGVSAGGATVTASLAGSTSATLSVSVANNECHPVINEFATAGATPADEWVEIFNPCTVTIDVDGWTLNYRAATAGAGTDDTNLMATLAGEMTPSQLRLYAGIGYVGTDTPDGGWTNSSGIMKETVGSVGIRSGATNVGPLVDAVAYGDITAATFPFLERRAAPEMSTGSSAARLPYDGKDENDGAADFVVSATVRTPHQLNAP